MKKKKYVRPECDIVYSYDLESELMYGNTLGGGDLGFPTGSGGGSGSGGGNLGGEPDDGEGGGSDRAKGNRIWGSLWED